jgi:aspartyl-tRNA(Asn)/glutamyl-tRNA(Gln) amidotransferase subunit B
MLNRSNVLITLGLEIHSQVNSDINKQTGQKLFSHSLNMSKEDIPNSHINYFDLAIPGTMPQLNLFCLQQAVKTGLALNATIPHKSEFDRKHYFYPDLPAGFQITQNFYPIVKGGYIILKNGKKIRIHHIHLEADAGCSIHHDNYSLINYNRAMVGLMEIVTEPDMNSIEECIEFVKELKLLLQYIKTCNCNMEEGNFRVDVNVSIRKNESDPLGTRVEIKNLNSFKFIETAIESEVETQI